MKGEPEDRKNDEMPPGVKRHYNNIITAVIISLALAVGTPFFLYHKKCNACFAAAQEFEGNLMQARACAGEREDSVLVQIDESGTKYVILYRPDMTRTYQVSDFFMGTKIMPEGGKKLVFFVEDIDPSATDLQLQKDYDQSTYYSVKFQNQTAAFEVRILPNGTTRIVKLD
jgi:hypothetical protein